MVENKVKKQKIDKVWEKIGLKWELLTNSDIVDTGRIWIGWRPDFYEVTLLSMGAQWMDTKCLIKELNISCYVTVVYGYNQAEKRVDLWTALEQINHQDLPWLILGDFNAPLQLEDREGGDSVEPGEIADFQKTVDVVKLQELKTFGPSFTWSNRRLGEGRVYSKLDRALVNEKWMEKLSDSKCVVNVHHTSDHFPLVVQVVKPQDQHVRPFKFYNMWCRSSQFKSLIRQLWRAGSIHNLRDFYRQLRYLQKPLLKLNQREFDHIELAARKAWEEWEEAQVQLLSQPMNSELQRREHEKRKKSEELQEAELQFLLQRSKLRWIKDGDKPTKVFYAAMRARQYQNHIVCVLDGNTVIQGRENLETHLMEHFRRQFGVRTSSEAEIKPEITRQGKILTVEQQARLVRPFTVDEIKQALYGIQSDKSPGADGFSSCFFKECWDILGEDFIKAVRSFFDGGELPEDFRKAVITLIPKVPHPQTANDYRPISCCSVVYKVVTKMLCSRLGVILPDMINLNQGAFVKGRLISHNIMLAQELLHRYNSKQMSGSCVIQIDIQRAFDSVHWDFVIKWLEALHFPSQFISWVNRCITTPTFCLALNGSYTGSFEGGRGVKQGDPLSPLLFVVCMEYFTRLLKLEYERKAIGYHQRCRRVEIQSLLFADDLLIFSKADEKSMKGVTEALDQFKAVSGLAVNNRKSKVVFSAMDSGDKILLADILNITQDFLPLKYLGLPISGVRWDKQACSALVGKMAARIKTWGTRNMSYAGKIQLVNTVLMSMASYWASVFQIPQSIHQDITRLCRDFLWGREEGKKGFYPVAWDTITRTKKQGGWGLRDSSVWNKAVLCRHIWDILCKKDVLWIRWVHEYYLKRVNFEDCTVTAGQSWSWKKVVRLKQKMLPVLQQCTDAKGKFHAGWAYDILKGKTVEDPWAKLIWNSKIQPKHSVFWWMFLKGRLATLDRLGRLGIHSQSQNDVCVMCDRDIETAVHLFSQCQFVKELLGGLQMRGLSTLREVKKKLRCWSARKYVMQLSVLTMALYCVWRERNARCFQGTKRLAGDIGKEVLDTCKWRLTQS